MPRIEREAEVSWEGSVARGAGHMTAASSGSFEGLPFSLPSRIERVAGRTSPEELLAAAHGGCFAMSLGSELARVGAEVAHLSVHCTITMDEVGDRGHQIVHSSIVATATGTGFDAETLARVAEEADRGCPFSTLLRNAGAGVEVTASMGSV